jgi:predicted signal transduction protein with EAL and GGDEF domain
VARLGGDEFGVVLPGLSADQAVEVFTGLRAELAREVVLEDIALTIEATFGLARYPDHGNSVDAVLQCADAAMYRGKHSAVGVVVYDGASATHPTQWLVVQAELRHALQRDELVLRYQPKLDLATGRVRGVEALVRWQHPRRGLLAPSVFLPAAEQSGLIEPLTAWVLRRALADQADWIAAGRSWPVAVNVSARNPESSAFAGTVTDLLEEFGADTDALVIEVTETALAVDPEAAARTVVELAARGIDIAVDDFGTGYTSLSQLRVLPVLEVKIDRAFVENLDRDEKDRAIVRAVIDLAHGLGCRVTAEGVETPQVRDWLAVTAGRSPYARSRPTRTR